MRKSSELLYWWDCYHQFSPGEGNLPHVGEVLHYYRTMSGYSQEDAAELLGWTKRYVQMLESKGNTNMPDLITRRIMLIKALNIPPALLGLSSLAALDSIAGANEFTPGKSERMIDLKGAQFYEGMLSLAWQFYYESNVTRTAKQVDACFDLLKEDATETSGVERDHYAALESRYYQLLSLVHRDQGNADTALADTNQALTIAEKLNNAELIASSLLRRARILISHKKDFQGAYQDSQRMIPYADLCRDPLKGKCYQMAGESTAYVAGDDRSMQDRSLSYFATALRLARRGDMTPDGSFVQLDVTSVSIEKAKALRLFGRFDEAHEALALAHRALPANLPRWKVNLLLEEGQVYLAEGDVESASTLFSDALTSAKAFGLSTKINSIQSLYQACVDRSPKSMAVRELGKALSA